MPCPLQVCFLVPQQPDGELRQGPRNQCLHLDVTHRRKNKVIFLTLPRPGKPYWRGRLSTVDLLVLTGLDQLLLIVKILFTFFTNQATLMRRSTVLSFSLRLVFPASPLTRLSVGTLPQISVENLCLARPSQPICLWERFLLKYKCVESP